VDKIWGGQSILSAWDDLFDLTMVRWNKHEEWSPWNCILLTKDEADAHEKLVNLEEVWSCWCFYFILMFYLFVVHKYICS